MEFHRHSFPLAPLVDDGAPGNRAPQVLTGTGTTEASNSRKLLKGKVHIIFVGAVAVYARFSSTKALATAVSSSNGIFLPAGSQFAWVPEEEPKGAASVVGASGSYGSTFVYIEAADGASAYQAAVIQYQS